MHRQPEEVSLYRGTPTEPGKNSPYRNRSVEENLELFENMKNGVASRGFEPLTKGPKSRVLPLHQEAITY